MAYPRLAGSFLCVLLPALPLCHAAGGTGEAAGNGARAAVGMAMAMTPMEAATDAAMHAEKDALADVPLPVLPVPRVSSRPAPAVSPGAAESLPENPARQGSSEVLGETMPHFLQKYTGEWAPVEAPSELEPVSMAVPRFSTQTVAGMVSSSPIAGVARRIRSDRFNTADAVADDFAICYRLSGRSSVQVVPGDPAPVKLPVTSMRNSAGVTVGMVLRLRSSR